MQHNRLFGQHFTSKEIFRKHIFPEIKEEIYNYTFIDYYAGEGNLILPILDIIPLEQRIDYFKKHIFLFEIQKSLVEKAIKNAEEY